MPFSSVYVSISFFKNSNGDFLGMDDESSDLSSDVESGTLVGSISNRRPSSTQYTDSMCNDEEITGLNDEGDVLFERHLLDGFPSWLEKLFGGTTTRYYINYWPDNIK